MTAHLPKLFIIDDKPRGTVIECSCGEFEEFKRGRGPRTERRLLALHTAHAAWEPPATGTEVDKTGVDYSYRTNDEGQTGWVACWDGKPPNAGDYLILRNGSGAARYKVTKVKIPMDVDPRTMWIANIRHAPSTRP